MIDLLNVFDILHEAKAQRPRRGEMSVGTTTPDRHHPRFSELVAQLQEVEAKFEPPCEITMGTNDIYLSIHFSYPDGSFYRKEFNRTALTDPNTTTNTMEFVIRCAREHRDRYLEDNAQ